MILDSGLDAACTTTASPPAGSETTAAYPAFCAFITYAAYGTGSAAPDPSDTALNAQVGSRSNNRGGFNNVVASGQDSVNNIMWREQTFTRVFAISANVNATEWGLAAASSGPLSVRDLFRADPNDPLSSPITLTLEDGDQLQLVITLRVETGWAYQNKSFTITGAPGNDSNGTYDGRAAVTTGAVSTDAAIRDALRSVWPGDTSFGNAYVFTADQSSVGLTDNNNASFAELVQGSTSAEAYTPGTHYRDVVGTFSTAIANGDIYAFGQGRWNYASPVNHSGFQFILIDPPYLTKTSTHRLTLTVRRSISRL